ncbi:Ig-like domain-containing protein [bacterium]|nr:Ig-like domain-containing protein [bacterium]
MFLSRRCSSFLFICVSILMVAAGGVAQPDDWTNPAQDANEQWPSFDEFHRMSDHDKEQVELYWLMNVYESDPKWESNYHFTSTGYADDGLSDVPGWLRDAAWSSSASVDAVLYGEEVGESKIWGSCAETAERVESDLKLARETFLETYYPPEPPPGASYVPDDYADLVSQPVRNLQWDFTNKPESVSFTGLEPAWATHQSVKVYPKGADGTDEGYVFDPWATGYPEVLAPEVAHNRAYVYSGEPMTRPLSPWEMPPPPCEDCPPGDDGTDGKTGGDDPPSDDTTPAPPGGSGGDINWLPQEHDRPPTNRDTPDDNVDAARGSLASGHRAGVPEARVIASWVRTARWRQDTLLADQWASDEFPFLIGNVNDARLFFDPWRLFCLDHAGLVAPGGLAGSIQDTVDMMRRTPRIAVLANGYFRDMAGILAAQRVPVTLVRPQDIAAEAENYSVLIVPSGGFSGLDNAEFFRQALDDYVSAGGTLAVFCQATGDQYLAAPGTAGLQAAGWQEDQTCVHNSAVITQSHPILAGQHTVTPDFKVDGYFSSWPDHMTPVLYRTRNPVPMVLVYDHGEGHVLLTTSYADWGGVRSAIGRDDANLLRHISHWGLWAGTEMPLVGAGLPINLPVTVTNYTLEVGTQATFRVVDSSGMQTGEPIIREVLVLPGETTQVNIDVVAPDTPGIYEIDADLLAGDLTVPQISAAVFAAVRQFPMNSGATQIPEITALLTSDRQTYAPDEVADVTMTVYNQSAQDQVVELTFPGYFGQQSEVRPGVTVPAGGSAAEVFQLEMSGRPSDAFRAYGTVYSSPEHSAIARVWRGIWVNEPEPRASVEVVPGGDTPAAGATVAFECLIQKDYFESDQDVWAFDFTLTGPGGEVLHQESFGTSPQPSSFAHLVEYSFPNDAPFGPYRATCQGQFEGAAGGASVLLLLRPGVAGLRPADNIWTTAAGSTKEFTASFETFAPGGQTGTLRLEVPSVAFDQTEPFMLGSPGVAEVSFDVPFPPATASGEHTVTLTADASGQDPQAVDLTLFVPAAAIVAELNTGSVLAGDPVQVLLTNYGGAYSTGWEYALTLKDGFKDISETSGTVSLAPGESATVAVDTFVDLRGGAYAMAAAVSEPGESPRLQRLPLEIQGTTAWITADTDRKVYATTDNLSLSSEFGLTSDLLPDAMVEFQILEGNNALTIKGETGSFRSDATRIATSTGGIIAVYGPEMGLKMIHHFTGATQATWGDIRTGADPVEYGDVAFDSTGQLLFLDGPAGRIETWDLDPSPVLVSDWMVRDSEGLPRVSMDVGPNDNVYVLRHEDDSGSRAGTSYVELYDSAGTFLSQAGSYGSSDGQFLSPTHVVADSEGSFFVVDPGNHRVVRLGTDGVLLASYDVGELAPVGVAFDPNFVPNGRVAVLTEDDYSGPNSEEIYFFTTDGVPDGTYGVYVTKGRDLAQDRTNPARFVALEALNIYGARINVLAFEGYTEWTIRSYSRPAGIDRLSDGRLVIADPGSYSVWMYDPASGLSPFVVPQAEPALGNFSPQDLIVGEGDIIYAIDGGVYNQYLRVFDANGALVQTLPGEGTPFPETPEFLDMDGSGNLYVYFNTDGRVVKMDPEGNELSSFYVAGSEQRLTNVDGMAVDPQGRVWLAWDDDVTLRNMDGSVVAEAGSFTYVYGLDVGSDGLLYLWDLLQRGFVIDDSGDVISSFAPSPPSLVTCIRAMDSHVYFGLNSAWGIGWTGGSIHRDSVVPDIARGLSGTAGQTIAPPVSYPYEGTLVASLSNRFGQVLASGSSSFSVTDDAVAVAVLADRANYSSGELGQLRCLVANQTDQPLNDQLVLAKEDGDVFFEQSLELGPSETLSFEYPFETSSSSFTATLDFGPYHAESPINVVSAAVQIQAVVPERVTCEPFDVPVTLTNLRNSPASGRLTVSTAAGSRWADVALAPKESQTHNISAWVTADDSVRIVLSSGLRGSASYPVTLGPAVTIDVTADEVYPLGNVTVPYMITNAGALGASVPITFSTLDESTVLEHFVDAAEQVAGKVAVTLREPVTELFWQSPYASGSALLRAGGASMQLVGAPEWTLEPGDSDISGGDAVTVTLQIENLSDFPDSADLCHDAKGVFRGESQLFLEGGETGTAHFSFKIPDDLPAGTYPLLVSVDSLVSPFEYEVAGPAFGVSAALDAGCYSSGDSAALAVHLDSSSADLSGIEIMVTAPEFQETRLVDLPNGVAVDEEFAIPVLASGLVVVDVSMPQQGRSAWIDMLNLSTCGGLRVTVDEESYLRGEVVAVTVVTDAPTTASLSAFEANVDMVFDSAGTQEWAFTVPDVPAGRYTVDYLIGAGETPGEVYFDVDGPELRVIRVAATPSIPVGTCDLAVSVTAVPHLVQEGTVNFEIRDDLGDILSRWAEPFSGMTEGAESTISTRRQVAFHSSGLHVLTYAAYADDTDGAIATGQVFFDAFSERQPEVVEVSPREGSEEVPVGMPVSIRFNRRMDAPSVEAAFAAQPAFTPQFEWPAANVLVVRPADGRFRPLQAYTCTIDTQARDREDQALATPFSWSFTAGTGVTAATINEVLEGEREVTTEEVLLMDLNGDGVIDVADIILAITMGL